MQCANRYTVSTSTSSAYRWISNVV